MASVGALVNLINQSSDTQFLLSLITDELMMNYRSYTKNTVLNSTYDYASLSTKIAYDAFVNSSTTSISGNIQTDTVRTKFTISYAKQYISDSLGNKTYSYRIINEDSPVVVTANATSTVSPAQFTTDVQTVEQVYTMNIIKTSVTLTFSANIRDDFLSMPNIFSVLHSEFSPPIASNYYALRSMLLNYYSRDINMNVSYTASVLIGISFVLGVGMLLWNYSWKNVMLFAITTLMPIALSFLDRIESDVVSQQIIDQKNMFNQYAVLSGLVGSLAGIYSILYDLLKRREKRSIK